MVEYLGCLLNENMSGEAKTRMVLKKVNGKKKFLYGQSGYLLYPLKRILCNTLIPPHYDFSSLKTKLQSTQNSCIRYCFGL